MPSVGRFLFSQLDRLFSPWALCQTVILEVQLYAAAAAAAAADDDDDEFLKFIHFSHFIQLANKYCKLTDCIWSTSILLSLPQVRLITGCADQGRDGQLVACPVMHAGQAGIVNSVQPSSECSIATIMLRIIKHKKECKNNGKEAPTDLGFRLRRLLVCVGEAYQLLNFILNRNDIIMPCSCMTARACLFALLFISEEYDQNCLSG
ncbi:hypothetical protein Tsp_11178 [Trichinella spiralis]|uniref:hypothetical protein n=1 Tax=Trichinella spiralis TaxID=6334 RepID=UPI0001EFECB5|nr:hypothetical protein Tsp_11178 [Trichinella spiralis]